MTPRERRMLVSFVALDEETCCRFPEKPDRHFRTPWLMEIRSAR